MTRDDDLRTSLHDPTLDAGISATALLSGALHRKQRLQRRQRHVRAAAAAIAVVTVLGATAALIPDRTSVVEPARQPTFGLTSAPAPATKSSTPERLPTSPPAQPRIHRPTTSNSDRSPAATAPVGIPIIRETATPPPTTR